MPASATALPPFAYNDPWCNQSAVVHQATIEGPPRQAGLWPATVRQLLL